MAAGTLVGDRKVNVFLAGFGDDHIEGRNGDDYLDAGSDTDFVGGGGGTDECLSAETAVGWEG